MLKHQHNCIDTNCRAPKTNEPPSFEYDATWGRLVLECFGIQENEYVELPVGSHNAPTIDLCKTGSLDTDDSHSRLYMLVG